MSIKSDKWIRRMAEEHGMISPFEAGQVREGKNGKMISMAHQVMVTMSAVRLNLKSLPISIQRLLIRKTLMKQVSLM